MKRRPILTKAEFTLRLEEQCAVQYVRLARARRGGYPRVIRMHEERFSTLHAELALARAGVMPSFDHPLLKGADLEWT